MEEKRAPSEDIRNCAMGALAAFLYGSTIFVPFFAAPLQASWTRGGFKAYLSSLAVALLCIAGWMLWQYKGIAQIGMINFLLTLSVPFALAAAIGLVNSRLLASWPMVYRTMAGGALVSAIVGPYIFSMFKDAGVESYLRKIIEQLTTAMRTTEGEGFNSAVLKSSLDPETLFVSTRRVITDIFAAVFFAITFLGHWIGTRMAGKDAAQTHAVPRLDEYSVPESLIWVFLVCWFGVLISRLPALQTTQGSQMIEAVAWNSALIVSFCYVVQGFAIIRHLLGRLSPSGFLRWSGTLLVVLLLVNIVTGAWAAGILTVLGATETWVPYRISKGVQT
jgi:hypothetical protein